MAEQSTKKYRLLGKRFKQKIGKDKYETYVTGDIVELTKHTYKSFKDLFSLDIDGSTPVSTKKFKKKDTI